MRTKLWLLVGPRRLRFSTVDSQPTSPPVVNFMPPGSSGCRLGFTRSFHEAARALQHGIRAMVATALHAYAWCIKHRLQPRDGRLRRHDSVHWSCYDRWQGCTSRRHLKLPSSFHGNSIWHQILRLIDATRFHAPGSFQNGAAFPTFYWESIFLFKMAVRSTKRV